MSRRTERNVGVIGLGIIGQRVADCLRRRGFHAFVWNRTPHPYPNFVGSPAELAELCDFIQIFVSDDDALLQMVAAMKPALNAHHVIMAHCTVAPHTMREAAEIVHRRGAQLLDAPFTGSKGAAEKGELVYYLGGDDAAYRRARPVLEASSKQIIEVGDIGQATTIKVATNMITAATVQAAAEALALVHTSGLPLEAFAKAMESNGSNSGTLAMKLPKMLEGDFEPHFSVKHMLKDVEIASRLGRWFGLTLSTTEVARDALVRDAEQGHSDDDYSSVMRVFFPDGPPGKTSYGIEEEQAALPILEEQELVAAVESAIAFDKALEVEVIEPARIEKAEDFAREEAAREEAKTVKTREVEAIEPARIVKVEEFAREEAEPIDTVEVDAIEPARIEEVENFVREELEPKVEAIEPAPIENFEEIAREEAPREEVEPIVNRNGYGEQSKPAGPADAVAAPKAPAPPTPAPAPTLPAAHLPPEPTPPEEERRSLLSRIFGGIADY